MKRMRFDDAPDVRSVTVRVAAIDVGFDLRALGYAVDVPLDCDRATYDRDGERWYVQGTREEVVAELLAAGYIVRE